MLVPTPALYLTWEIIVEKAQEQLGYPLQVASVNITPLGDAVINGAVLYDVDGTAMVTAERAVIVFNWRALVANPSPESIRKIEIENPTVHLRKVADNEWNIERFVETQNIKEGPKASISAKIFITGGTVDVNDLPAPVVLQDINAELDFSEPNMLHVSVQARKDKTDLAVDGNMYVKRMHGQMNVHITNGNIVEYLPFLPQSQDGELTGGVFSADIVVSDSIFIPSNIKV